MPILDVLQACPSCRQDSVVEQASTALAPDQDGPLTEWFILGLDDAPLGCIECGTNVWPDGTFVD